MTNSDDRNTSIEELYTPKNPKEKEGVDAILVELSEDEKAALTDNGMPLRYFRAEKSNVEKAIQKLRATLVWRKEFGVSQLVSSIHGPTPDQELAEMLHKEHETGKMYVRGYDSGGRAIIYMRGHRENTYHEENNMRNLVFSMEKAIACSARSTKDKPASDRITLIVDFEHFKISKAPPLSSSLKTIQILQDHYPERLYRSYNVHPTLMFRAFWRMVRPFIDPVTKERIVFCTGKVTVADDVPDPAKLEFSVGGTNEAIADFDHKVYLKLPFDVSFDE